MIVSTRSVRELSLLVKNKIAAFRQKSGRFAKKNRVADTKSQNSSVLQDHDYGCAHLCPGSDCDYEDCPLFNNIRLGKNASRTGWKEGRRIVELDVLLSALRSCKFCRMGPIPLTYYNVVGEMQKGLGGYLYVRCDNVECHQVNMVPYGKTHRQKGNRGMPCFVINTKLGTSMIDSVGGPQRVNNVLSTLNLKTIDNKNLKKMERRAGKSVEAVAAKSTQHAANESFNIEMNEIAEHETKSAKLHMEDMIDEDLELCLLPDTSPAVRFELSRNPTVEGLSGGESESEESYVETSPALSNQLQDTSACFSTPENRPSVVTRIHKVPDAPHRTAKSKPRKPAKCVKLASKFPCRSRTGMTCAVDTAWHKRGFDSLTSHTFFMSKSCYGKKVVKTMVSHRTCATCKWWKRNRPFQKVPKHRCVHTHTGSARSMESASGVQGMKELIDSGTPVEYLEGDGDNTLITRLKTDLNLSVKKRYDKNHVVKNIGKRLYQLQLNKKKLRLSKTVINHIMKCVKYVLAKNQGNKAGLENNLKALVPHQFGDHSKCEARFCGFQRKPAEKYQHRSLPYKSALRGEDLRSELDNLFQPVIANAEQYTELGSSQQCEHANREVTLRAPKSLHYGNSEALDFRVHATAAFINEGRHYIAEVNKEAGLSPGLYTERYAAKQMASRKGRQDKMLLPSTKRRRLQLKQERATTQGANEALEGQTYQSGIGHEADPDVEQLPEAVPKGNFQPVQVPPGQKPTLIMFDLETTDLIRGRQMPHITQIAAVELESRAIFNSYVVPKIPITYSAQQVTGIAVSTTGEMTVNGQPVKANSITNAVNDFIQWLSKFQCIFLVAHNGRKFDFPVFSSTLMNIQLTEKFNRTVCGLIDSLSVFKKVHPDMSCYKQEHLVSQLLGLSYAAHDATEDVKSLGMLFTHANMTCTQLVPFTFTPAAVQNQRRFNNEKAKHINSLSPLVSNGVIKMPTAENIAGSGLGLKHLRKIFDRSGEDGLNDVFTSKNSEGQVRVTSAKRTLESVIPKLADYFQKN